MRFASQQLGPSKVASLIYAANLQPTSSLLSSPTQSLLRPSVAARASASAASPSMAPLKPAGVTLVPDSSLHVSKPTWWLTSRFHFSFADWWDPSRSSFGVLRVLNDDLVRPQAGFGTHPHRDAEIFSYVVDGQLSHADSMGNREALPRGCVQYMSAGTGVTHSEMNDHPTETTRFLQLWLTPDARGHKPQYGSRRFEKGDRHNTLLHILGGTTTPPEWESSSAPSPIHFHADANVYVSESDANKEFDVTLGAGRQAYLVCIEGGLSVNGTSLKMREAAKIRSTRAAPTSLKLSMGAEGAHLLMVEMALASDGQEL